MKFLAQIKNVSIKQLVSGDYSLDIVLRVDNPGKDLLDHINEVNTNQGVVCVINRDFFQDEEGKYNHSYDDA